MKLNLTLCALALAGLATVASAQIPIVSNIPGVFDDISVNGGTAIVGASDDSSHAIITTVGNVLFPAGNVTIGNNGLAYSGGFPGSYIPYYNSPLTPTGFIPNMPSCQGAICAFWDDLYPSSIGANNTLWWKDDAINGVLTIMWKDDNHFFDATPGNGITFEIQVFATGPIAFQVLYQDTTFTLGHYANDGAAAVIGYAADLNPIAANGIWSNYTASVTVGTVISCLLPVPLWQLNQPGADFQVDATLGSSLSPAQVNRTADNVCSFGTISVAFSSTNLGNPWDLGVTSNPCVPGDGLAGFQTGGGQFVNVNLTDPSFFFLNGGAFNVPFGGNFSFLFGPGGPFSAGAQFAVIDGAQIDFVSLSQGTNYSVALVGSPTNPPIPTGDDTADTFSFETNSGGGCSFSFFGTVYTEFSVTTNGRVMFGGADSSFYPSVGQAQNGVGTIGAWCDLNQGSGGTLQITSPSFGVTRVDWLAVPYFYNFGSNTFGVEMDSNTGNITIDGLNTIGQNGNYQFLGIASGNNATDPGPAGPFDGAAAGFYVGPPASTDMIYSIGVGGSNAINNASALVFSPSIYAVTGNYDYTIY